MNKGKSKKKMNSYLKMVLIMLTGCVCGNGWIFWYVADSLYKAGSENLSG